MRASDRQYCIVFTTCGNKREAERIAETLVSERLAACVQIDSITSCYRWQGVLHREPEWRLTIKTRTALYAALRTRIAALHSYQVPEIVRIAIADGAAAYLSWIDESTVRRSAAVRRR